MMKLQFGRRRGAIGVLAMVLAASPMLVIAACGGSSAGGDVSASERQAIVDSLTRQVKAAYDLSQPHVVDRLLSLYPPSGRIVGGGWTGADVA